MFKYSKSAKNMYIQTIDNKNKRLKVAKNNFVQMACLAVKDINRATRSAQNYLFSYVKDNARAPRPS